MAISDERLSAFIDGRLSPEEGAALEAAIAADPVLAQRVRAEQARRARMARLRRMAEDHPPAERLVAIGRADRGRPAELIDLSAARAARMRQRRAPIVRKWSRRGALVGVGVLSLAVAAEFLLNPGPTPMISAVGGGLIARGALADALTRRLSTSPVAANAAVRVGPSFLAGDKVYCRNFTINDIASASGVACREPEGWRIRLAADQSVAAGGGFQASVAAMKAGPPLSAQAEAMARAKGWRA